MNRDFLQYVGFILTTGLSLILSILLFTSVADSRLYWLLLMGIAISMELGKIITVNDKTRMNRVISVILISVSVMGSAGGMNRAVSLVDNNQADTLMSREVLQAQVDQTLAVIEQNNTSIDFYRARNEIRGMVRPLQEENREMQQELEGLQAELEAVKPAEVPELVAVLQLLSTLMAMPMEWVRAFVILLLAGLLDALTVSFIRCGVLDRFMGVEDGFQPDPEDKAPLPSVETEVKTEPALAPATPVAAPGNVTAMDGSYPAFRRMILARRDRGETVLSQRACIRETGQKERVIRRYYAQLQSEGIIEKRGGQFGFVLEPKQKVMRLV